MDKLESIVGQNVRELENVVERLSVFCMGEAVKLTTTEAVETTE